MFAIKQLRIKIRKFDINKNITEALSGSSVLLNYQLNGYASMQ
tara:strand:- start:722 stop:850 length:129 start_codon:yes stop_codon:yes gene_type:complete